MDKPLSSETLSQIRALCESIAQRDQLGEGVQEELRGHIEDKVIAYLEGREALTERDAVILAREHFGSASVVKAHLQSTHLHTVIIDIARRTAVITCVTYLVQMTAVVLLRVAFIGNPFVPYRDGINAHPINMDAMVLTSAISVVSVAVVMLAFKGLQRISARMRLDAVPTWLLITSALVSVILCLSLPTWWRYETTIPIGAVYITAYTRSGVFALFVLHFAIALFSCFTWVWWVDQWPRTLFTLIAGGVAWLGANLLQPYAIRGVGVIGRLFVGEPLMDAYSGNIGSLGVTRHMAFQFGFNLSTSHLVMAVFLCVMFRALKSWRHRKPHTISWL